MIVLEVEREVRAVIDSVGVIIELDAELPPGLGIPVGQAVDGKAGRRQGRQHVVEQLALALRVLRGIAEAGVDAAARVVTADVQIGKIGTGRWRLGWFPFQLVIALDGEVVERAEAEIHHVDRNEVLLDLGADAVEVVGVDRIGGVDAVDHQRGALAPVDQLAANLEAQVMAFPQRQLAEEVAVEILQVGAGLAQHFSIGALTAHTAARPVEAPAHPAQVRHQRRQPQAVEDRVRQPCNRLEYAFQRTGQGGAGAADDAVQDRQRRSHPAHLVDVPRGDFVRMGLREVVVDHVVEKQGPGEDAEVAVLQGQILGHLERRLENRTLAAIVEIAILAVDTGRTRSRSQVRRGKCLRTEQSLAGLIGRRAHLRIDGALGDQVLAWALHADTDAAGECGIEHALHGVIRQRRLKAEIQGARQSWHKQKQSTQGPPISLAGHLVGRF